MPAKSANEPPLPQGLKAQLDVLTATRWDDVSADEVQAAAHLSQLRLDWKALGNACYSKGCFLVAIQCYSRLLELPGGDTAQIRSNRSAAYLQSLMLAGPSLALKDAEKAVQLDPKWFKAHLRVGDAHWKRGHLAEADAAYREALALQPECASAIAGLRALQVESEKLCAAAATLPPRTAIHAAAAAQAKEEEPPLTQEQLVQIWKKDISTHEGRTGCRPRQASLSEADREQGAAIKQAFLSRFRAKLESNDELSATLRERREEVMLCGEKVNYREADKLRSTYSHATNGIGLGISSDAYKEHTGRVNHRTW
ncbi:putative Tetratricopeptide repeat [Leishmania utingensis]|uniref:Tetratricopeptide repeat n=1 Tax=Leishmania utingensis TaxID=653362 RepID=A0AAW2ZUU2_9TRYP